jgi:hypothetical protein
VRTSPKPPQRPTTRTGSLSGSGGAERRPDDVGQDLDDVLVVCRFGAADLLADLNTWATAPGVGTSLLHGPGGQGKTRLAHQFGERLTRDGWLAEPVRYR